MNKTLLIVGGGFAGITIAMQCRNYKVVLIDQKHYFEYTPSMLNALIDPAAIFNITIPYTQLARIHRFTYLNGKLIRIVDNVAYLESGVEQPFDYCVICTGASQPHPIKSNSIKLTDRLIELKAYQDRIVKSQTILVIGGGTVGVEAACEIKYHHPNKSVVLIARNKLLPTMPVKTRNQVIARLNQLQVEFKEHANGFTFVDKFDVVFDCTGNKFNDIKLEDQLHRGQIKVDEQLRVIGYNNIYSAGDVSLSSLAESKTAFGAEMYGEYVAYNLNNLNNQRRVLWIPNTYVISLGGKQAVFIFENLSMKGYFGYIFYLMKLFIEYVVMGDFRGVIGMHTLHQLMNYAIYIFLHLYMLFQLFYAMLPLNNRITPKHRQELTTLSQELLEEQNKQQ